MSMLDYAVRKLAQQQVILAKQVANWAKVVDGLDKRIRELEKQKGDTNVDAGTKPDN